MSFLLREPPTKESIRDARNALHLTRREIAQLTNQIDTADAALAVLVHDSKKNINSLIAHRAHLEATELRTLAYLSPIRKLPSELLRDIFISNFDEYPCCAWVLAAVCSSWRRLVLQTPKLWSKVTRPLLSSPLRLIPSHLRSASSPPNSPPQTPSVSG